MTLRFGTDGLRGRAGKELTTELAARLGRAAARVVEPDKWCVGRDTRESGPELEAAVAEGLALEGADVELVGVLPTPAIAMLAARNGAGAVVVSASHNPWFDNGLKVFGPGGRKLDEATEASMEATLDELANSELASSRSPGTITRTDTGGDAYVASIVSSLGGRSLDGLSIVLDCGHGAASPVAGAAFLALGADVLVLHADPDGRNINDGVGSTDPSTLARHVLVEAADLGLAFDGDADRLIAVDGAGHVVDGDRIMGLLAVDMAASNDLHDRTLVVTVMSNLGLQRAMDDQGIDVVVTPVGDRHVLAAIEAGGYSLGGEQSGHVILADHATTGDGILAGVFLSDLVKRSGSTLASLAGAVMTRYPQVLVNVAVAQRRPDVAQILSAEIAASERTLEGEGRILVRPSGTEPLVRVMVEAHSEDLAEAVAQNLAAEVARKFGRHPSR